MTCENGYFKAPDKKDIFYQCWLPQQDTRAALIVVHGVAEHSGRYMNLVNALVPEGYSVYGLDHYGHGRSGGRRLFVPSFDYFTQCLDTLVDRVRQWEPGKKCVLVGHSMGGLICAAYLTALQDKVDGAILSGPAVKVPEDISALTIWAARIFSKLAPALGIKQLAADQISRDPEVVRAYVNDPLVSTGKLTARLAEQLLWACQDLEKTAPGIQIPLYILQGASDTLVDPDGARQFHDAVCSADKQITVYADRFHEIFNDPGHDEVFSDIRTWLNRHRF